MNQNELQEQAPIVEQNAVTAPPSVPARAHNTKPTEDPKTLLKAANLRIKELEQKIVDFEQEKELMLQKNEILFKDNMAFKKESETNTVKFNHLKTSLMNSLQTTADLIQLFK